ncbi:MULTISPECIES: ABC-three component system protein [Chromobacterium]|uniref:ABC-three component system protein n=1 Tax=Chromobacterium TaxID=535 RepID=UPI00188813AC|nr:MULTISPECIES: ABC-three component system protein [Chromobacterium]QOZ83030.1 hypothetical protein DXT74_08070 [Chromobacterium sp. Rain0013]WON83113.1 hypothetical protein OK026_18505 [Chromobacterium haemolyticum]
MSTSSGDLFSAGEQGLGYIYQPRLALLQLLQLPEDTSVLIEKDDDLDFIDNNGAKSLGSLKHKAEGERVTDLSTDFWKSVRIWLSRYNRDGRREASLRFFLFTTASVSEASFLRRLVNGAIAHEEDKTLSELVRDALAKTKSELIQSIGAEFTKLDEKEQEDFLSRIVIFDDSPRIQNLPPLIKDLMRSIRREHRDAVFERLEGWWNESIINLLVGKRTEAMTGFEVSDKLAAFAEEYQADNLPINFRRSEPAGGVSVDSDSRLFVRQLREIGITSDRLRNAILDYYRAFEQRSLWARENLLVSGELEDYEERLVDEWSRYRDVVFEELDESSAEDVLVKAGRALYRWADLESGNIAALRIRERVAEPYVVRGGFHILANFGPPPKVYWHPRFLERLEHALGAKK